MKSAVRLVAPVLAVALAGVFVLPASAADGEPTAQQQRFGACSKQAKEKGLSGDARKSFMSDCASGKTPMTPQQRMAACNKEAGEKKLAGQERKDFMSGCLKAS